MPRADATTRQFDRVIAAVIERGYDDDREDIDDYAVLIGTFEHRKLVIFQLYDSYFPPRRHEFELQLLSSLVDAVASNPAAAFVGGAIAGGVVGNAAYDLLKRLLTHLSDSLKPVRRSKACFQQIEKNTERVMKFFEKRGQAGMKEICKSVDAEPDKVEPLLKLLGFRCRRKGKRKVWMVPATWR